MSRTIVSLLPQLQQFSSSPPDEVAALRELVEDLRSALQGSDARCLALEVALRRERSRTVPPPPGFSSTVPTQPTTSITLRQGKLVPTLRIKGHSSVAGGEGTRRAARRRDIRDPLLRELKLIRSSRDGQLEEAIKYNECLEEELRWAYQEVRKLQGVESALRKENTHIRLEFFKGTICRIWPDSSWSRYNKYQDDVIGLCLTFYQSKHMPSVRFRGSQYKRIFMVPCLYNSSLKCYHINNLGFAPSGGGQRRPGRLWAWDFRGFGRSRSRLSRCHSSSPGSPSWRQNCSSTGTNGTCGREWLHGHVRASIYTSFACALCRFVIQWTYQSQQLKLGTLRVSAGPK